MERKALRNIIRDLPEEDSRIAEIPEKGILDSILEATQMDAATRESDSEDGQFSMDSLIQNFRLAGDPDSESDVEGELLFSIRIICPICGIPRCPCGRTETHRVK